MGHWWETQHAEGKRGEGQDRPSGEEGEGPPVALSTEALRCCCRFRLPSNDGKEHQLKLRLSELRYKEIFIAMHACALR